MVIVLALGAALGYGASDFAGGVAARRNRPVVAVLGAGAGGTALIVALLPLTATPFPRWTSIALAAAAGLSGLAGFALLYRLMAREPISTVTPLTAVFAGVTPLAFGCIGGERPSPTAWLGMVLALAAIGIVGAAGGDDRRRLTPRAMLLALGSGAGFGGYFVLVAHAGHGAGLVPVLLTAKITALAVLVPAAVVISGEADRPRRLRSGVQRPVRRAAPILVAGVSDAAADVCFLLATRTGGVAVPGVITSLYPAVTVVLAIGVLRERPGWRPCVGLGLSVVSLALIAA